MTSDFMEKATDQINTVNNNLSEWQARVARLDRRVAALAALQGVAQRVASELSLDDLLAQILECAVEVMRSSAGSLLLFDPVTCELVFRVVLGGGGDKLLNNRFPYDQGIAGAAFTSRQPVVVHDVKLDERFLGLGDGPDFSTTSLIAVPLIHKGSPIGVLEVLNKKTGERFNGDDEELLLAFAAQAAISIENARLYRQVVAERDRILAIEEQVRRELARDLHDGPSQLLSAVIMNLRFLRTAMARKPERIFDEIDNMEQLSTQALRQIRDLLFDLRPVVLEAEGLRSALSVYVDRQRENQRVDIHLDACSLTKRFDSHIEAAIFSVVHEAVNNAKKHASPKNIWISTQQTDRALIITIQDDGCGFDLQQVEENYAQRGSLGLLNMRERAEIASGSLLVESTPGEGTRITLTIPLTQPVTTKYLLP
jgi:signal transduction histidine kinase